jgi:cyclophilin family peptidyl-prolyl cis-trans isomerase
MKQVLFPVFFVVTLCLAVSLQAQNKPVTNKTNKVEQSKGQKKNTMEVAIMKTSMGTIEIELFPEQAPKTVENFVGLAKKGYYNGLIFHRVIDKFMIQGGDPTGTGSGGESIWGKAFADEFSPALKHDKPGTLSMANAGPNTNGSQFFITLVPTPWLNGKHTIFGQVIKGLDVVQAIGKVQTKKPSDRPVKDVKIQSVKIETREKK